MQSLQVQKGWLQSEVGVWGEVDRALGRTGVQSFAIEGVLGELQVGSTKVLSTAYCTCDLTLFLF